MDFKMTLNKMRVTVIGLLFGIIGFVPIVQAGDLAIPKTWTAPEVLTAADLNTNFQEVEAEVDDNNDRISLLESPSATTGRLSLNPSITAGSTFTLDEAGGATSSTVSFGAPADYTSGGSNDVTIKAYISGCAGSDVSVSLSRRGYNLGSNGSLFLFPTFTTISIRSGALFTFFIEEVVINTTGFSDINEVTFQRSPTAAADTCTSDLFLRLITVDYPRDPSQ